MQAYDIREAPVELLGIEDERLFGTGDDRRPFSNILGELELYPWRRVAMIFDTSFNPYENTIKNLNTYVRAHDPRGDVLQLDYRYSSGVARQLNTLVQLKVTSRLSVLGYNKTSLFGNQNVETGAGFEAMFQCWGIRVLYRTTPDERKVAVAFSLLGAGDSRGLSLDF
jgi:hypothetical protein